MFFQGSCGCQLGWLWGVRGNKQRTDPLWSPEFVGRQAEVVGAEIEYVDMRYSNGFTIGWNNGSRTPVKDPEEEMEEMLASRGSN